MEKSPCFIPKCWKATRTCQNIVKTVIKAMNKSLTVYILSLSTSLVSALTSEPEINLTPSPKAEN